MIIPQQTFKAIDNIKFSYKISSLLLQLTSHRYAAWTALTRETLQHLSRFAPLRQAGNVPALDFSVITHTGDAGRGRPGSAVLKKINNNN